MSHNFLPLLQAKTCNSLLEGIFQFIYIIVCIGHDLLLNLEEKHNHFPHSEFCNVNLYIILLQSGIEHKKDYLGHTVAPSVT